jgi:hypothetical protein
MLIKLLCAFPRRSRNRQSAVHIWCEIRTFQCEECWPDSNEISYKRYAVSSHTESALSGNDIRDTQTYEVEATLLPMSTCGNRGKDKRNISCTNNSYSGNNSNHTNDCNYTNAVRTFRLRDIYTHLNAQWNFEGANTSRVIFVPFCTDCIFPHFMQLITSVCCINWVY